LSGRFDTVARETDAEYSELGLSDWVRRLPKPVAIFACNDVRARQVLVSCGNTGFRVPDDVAVLGVDNDEVICDLSSPPLSSVEPNTWQIGYTGAALLDKLMAGGSVAQQRVLISPQRVQVRRSTDVVAVEDPEVAAGLGYIQDNACRGICVSDVASTLSVSRTTLDRRFHRCLGRSPKDEIDRVRIDRARLLLDVTDYKIRVVASMAGYRSASQFVNAFKRITGCTPGMHRDRSNPGKQAAAGS
jgi:LacI family transcriptional regulator